MIAGYSLLAIPDLKPFVRAEDQAKARHGQNFALKQGGEVKCGSGVSPCAYATSGSLSQPILDRPVFLPQLFYR